MMFMPLAARVFSQAALLLILALAAAAQAPPSPATAQPVRIACRVLEAHTDDALKVTVVVFHRRDQAQRSQLAELLRGQSSQMVEVRAGDGPWHHARLVRLKSCFGRGLLILPAPAPFPERTEFMLRLPGDTH